MIELVIETPGQAERTVRLGDGEHGLGRHASNAVVLDDAEVSRRHARLLVDGDVVLLEDLGSNNGTLVRGEPVERIALVAGVAFEITPYTMRWRDPAAGRPALVVIEGAQAGARFPLIDDALSIGRGDDQDIVLDDQGASRSHAILVETAGRWMLRDSGSANGLFVNDAPCSDTVLSHGDRVQIGNTVLQFEVPGAPRRRPTAAEELAAFDVDDIPTDVRQSPSVAETSLQMGEAEPEVVPTQVQPAPRRAPSPPSRTAAAPSPPRAPAAAVTAPGPSMALPVVVLTALALFAVVVVIVVVLGGAS